jgi:anti-anti-sigma regulatory factor
MRKGAKARPKRASKPRVATPSNASTAKQRPAGKAARRKPSSPTDARLVLAADCTLREAPALKAQLLAANSATPQVTIEAGAVERIDAAGLQLLVAFARREAAAGRRLAWQSVSDELRGVGARLGLLDSLGLAAEGR